MRVDQQQRRVPGGVDGAAHRGDVAGDAGGGFVVHHAHRLDGVAGVGAQALLRSGRPARRGASAGAGRWPSSVPGTARNSGFRPSAQRHLLPQRGEVAGLEHQHRVAGAQGVDQRRLPGAGARGRVDRPPGGGSGRSAAVPASTFMPSTPNSGPRWSMVGRLIARRMRSGTGLGPGICRKWRPLGCWSRGIMRASPCGASQFCIQNAFVNREYALEFGQWQLLLFAYDQSARHGRHHLHPPPGAAPGGGACGCASASSKAASRPAPSSTSAS